MNRTVVLGIVAGVLVIAAVIVFSGGSGGGSDYVPPKAVAFQCTSCQYQFGVELRDELWAPLVCPKCSGEAAAATVQVPVGGGEPEVTALTKYTASQIQQMRQYRKDMLQEEHGAAMLADTPPDAWLASQPGEGAMIQYPKHVPGRWFSPEAAMDGNNAMLDQVQQKIRKEYKIIPVFPDDWPIENDVKLKY